MVLEYFPTKLGTIFKGFLCRSMYSSTMVRIWDISYWLVVFRHPSEKYEFVNWDDEIPNINGKIKLMFQTTKQYTVVVF